MGNVMEQPSSMSEALKSSIMRAANNTQPGFYQPLKTEYTLSHDGAAPIRITGPCFGALPQHMMTNKFDPKKTILRYLPIQVSLPEKTCFRWITLCQRVGILPRDKSPKEILYYGLVFDLGRDDLTPFDFYMQVAFCRYMREVPRLIENVLDLVDNGADFWAAFTYSHDLNVTNHAHSLCPSEVYSGPGRKNLSLAISMHRYIKNRGKVDDRKLWQVIQESLDKGVIPWEVHKRLLTLSFGRVTVAAPEQILDPHLIPLLHSETKEELMERIENLKEEHTHVQFTG